MAETQYVIKTIGGPLPGQRVVTGEWPPEETINHPIFEGMGEYRIAPERVSQMKDEDMIPGLIRGAEYIWYPKHD